MEILIFILVAAVALILVACGYLQQRKRRKELGRFAAEFGWNFDPSSDYSIEEHYPQFGVFTRGHSRYAFNTIRGEMTLNGFRWPVVMGDYRYCQTTGSGKNSDTHTYHFSYLVLDMPYHVAGELTIRSEGVFDKLASMIGFDDIDFESAEFSRRFHVKSDDKKFGYDVVHPRMMEFLLAGDPPAIYIAAHACCLHDGNRCWPAAEFHDRLSWAHEFFELWPRYLIEDLATRAQ